MKNHADALIFHTAYLQRGSANMLLMYTAKSPVRISLAQASAKNASVWRSSV